MMITKRIAKILRGNATPEQMMIACVLGSCLGFMPGFAQSPGLIALLALSLIVLNANLTLATMVAAGAKILSLLLLPVSFMIGRALLDGPTEPVFRLLINMPVVALFGFEYYVTTGGLLLGVCFGGIGGVLLIKSVRGLRTTLASLEEGSQRYQEWMAKWWVKLLVRVLIGSGSKESYASLLEKKGKIVRPTGVAVCVAVVVMLFGVQFFFTGSFITSALQRGLEQANGATVDLDRVDVDLAQGRITITGLAFADPNALERDLFRAAKIEIDVSSTSLLSKRLKLDRVVISDAVHGAKRNSPGRIVGNRPAPSKAIDPQQGEKTLEDYLQNPGQWTDRLAQIRRWIEKLSGPATGNESEEDAADGESFGERLAREARELGYARVAATHLIEGTPSFTVAELIAEKVRTDALQGETIDIRAENISTQPQLVDETPSVAMNSSAGTLRFGLVLAAVTPSGGENTVDFAYRGLPVDSIADNLSSGGSKPISGGTMDVSLKGTIRTTGGTYIDLPIQITLHDTTIMVGGKSAPVSQLTIPLGLRGPIDNPRIRLDDSQLADALVAAGASVLAAEARGRADELIKGAVPDVDLTKGLGGIDLGKGLSGLGGDKKTDADDKKSAKKEKSIGDTAKNLTNSLFGGKKKGKDGG